MANAQKFRQTNVPRQQGEQARLKTVQGPDYGSTYVITGSKATIGRGEECDIMISDLKASRKHAEFSAVPGGWQVRDLGSANGILHNGKVIRNGTVRSGDTLTLGETTFEFLSSEQGTMMLVAPPKSISEVQAQQAALAAQKDKIKSLGGLFGGGAGPGAAGAGGLLKNRKAMLYLAAGGMAAWLFLFDDPPKQPGRSPASMNEPGKTSAEYLRQFLPKSDDSVVGKKAKEFFQAGFREYRAKNYLRAKVQFETVLQMSPGHSLATMYVENCDREIKNEVSSHLKLGKNGANSGKLREARGHYQAVLRLLYRDQTHPGYIEAKEQLDKVEKMISDGGDAG